MLLPVHRAVPHGRHQVGVDLPGRSGLAFTFRAARSGNVLTAASTLVPPDAATSDTDSIADRRNNRSALRPTGQRIVRLTIDDVIRDGDQLLLRLGEPPSPVPTPFAKLLLTWISERDNMNTATNPDSRWLFPGRCAGQPMHPASLAALVNKLGVSTSTGRTAAIRQHVLEMPAPSLSPQPRSPPRLGSPGAVTPQVIT
jgi:hypothetical protein